MKAIVSSLFLLISVSLFAKVELPALFTDNMVLQQQTDAPIWGKASPGKTVEIVTSWDNRQYTVTAAADGSWKTHLKTPAAGGPYSISVSDGKKVALNNVMIGEVWICSGQSNMEMPLAGWGQVLNYKEEIADAHFPGIRLLHVDKETATLPQSNVKVSTGGWQVCSPATIAEFSSTAYFFGRNLHQNMNNVPIGLINTSWGGTIAEAWTSAQTLENMPDFREAIQQVKATHVHEIDYEQQLKAWTTQLEQADQGLQKGIAVWAVPALDDSGWATMPAPGVWEDKGLPNVDGIVWFRRTVDIPEAFAGKELTLSLAMIDDNDITYFNGQPIGATNGYSIPRNYTIPGKAVKKGKSVITVRVVDTGGGGGFHGQPEDMYLALKSGTAGQISLSGEWKYQLAVDLNKFAKAPESPNNPNRTTVLYNAMIHPLVPYAIQGAIWYQGESNVGRAEQYSELFPLMIRDWRSQWNRNFPFYFVQLANFQKFQTEPEASDWAELREAQLKTLNLENTGMAVIIDIGDADDIHPKNKQDVGIRLALAARAKTYGQDIPYSGPVYQSHVIEGHQIRIRFSNTDGGLKGANNEALKGFTIAGPDHQFYWANAEIEGNEVVVSSPDVLFPVAVRYAWANNPVCNLYNGAGLPASPFRTK